MKNKEHLTDDEYQTLVMKWMVQPAAVLFAASGIITSKLTNYQWLGQITACTFIATIFVAFAVSAYALKLRKEARRDMEENIESLREVRS